MLVIAAVAAVATVMPLRRALFINPAAVLRTT
jgi:hypothetical protein